MNRPLQLLNPEIEFRMANSRLPVCGEAERDSAYLDTIEVWPGRVNVILGKDVDCFAEHLDNTPREESKEAEPLRIIFVEDEAYGDPSYLMKDTSRGLNKTACWLRRHFGVSLAFFQHISPKLGYRVTGNGCFTRYNSAGEPISIDGFYSNSGGLSLFPTHIWFSHSVLERNASSYIIYNSSPTAKHLIFQCAEMQGCALLRPFAIDAFMQEDYLEKWTTRLSELRPQLVHYENELTFSKFTPVQNSRSVEELHNLSQHLHVARDNFIDLKKKLNFFLDMRERYLELSQPHFTVPRQDLTSVADSWALIGSRGDHGLRWAANYTERTSIRINLCFNLATQADSRTNLGIARLTGRISASAQRDSSSMITIAAVTMFFLPGSFVSALFSMVFFNAENKEGGQMRLLVAPQWWLFPAAAVPLTILVFIVWVVWRKRRNSMVVQAFENIPKSWDV
ncbi:hypothetical protein NLJ89_g10950 [Agrocybe chaxingu]|uniref:Uncharacterized protein n=1 Tax=Agrocybe chaxingu TaxID=84603 RepID=A0A9W8JQV1_9AGAR|nr:hypothetical protein NLJ89_g10950 [Agrocybe chaxingu]